MTCKGKAGWETGRWEVQIFVRIIQSDFSPDLLQLIDSWAAAVVAAEGGDGAVEEGGQGDHQVEDQGGRVLGQGDLQLDGLHILLVVVSSVCQLSLPETQTLLQQEGLISLSRTLEVTSDSHVALLLHKFTAKGKENAPY